MNSSDASNSLALYHQTAIGCSRLITHSYSTSFTLGIQALHPRIHDPIYAIYGFVRLADEIVDTFHHYPKSRLLQEFWDDMHRTLLQGISLNPVLHAFGQTVSKYEIPLSLIEAFMQSMATDLEQTEHQESSYQQYIFGSAEVVGLMCLKVFYEGNTDLYDQLSEPTRRLGAAFQKVNFLRDIRSDWQERGRIYFPNVNLTQFTVREKQQIESDIDADFNVAYQGILLLPATARQGVHLAYAYYYKLFRKIQRVSPVQLMQGRIRVPNRIKLLLLGTSYLKSGLGRL